ncbi:MAG: hypothetical protein NTZ40_15240 [Cyanobacteria bacterium]|nr:hypothetical protein [Cyanobacteriota bacterium]
MDKALKGLHLRHGQQAWGHGLGRSNPDSLPDGAPTDHFGRLQSDDALNHARSIVDAIAAALA